MTLYAITNETWIVGQDSSNSFESPVIQLDKQLRALNFQFKWQSTVKGKWAFEGSVYKSPYNWQQIVNCGEISVIASENQSSSIVSLDGVWLTLGFIHVRWIPYANTSGTFDCALRIVPT